MNKNCIINVAVGELYTTLQKRLLKSLEPYKDDFDIISWTGQYPENSKTHLEVHYGFKPHAFREAKRRGYTNILWLDAACYAITNPKVFFDIIEKEGCYLTAGGGALGLWCSDYYLDVNSCSREALLDIPLLSGAIYGFNMESAQGKYMFEELVSDEKRGYFMNCYKDDSSRIDCHKIIDRPVNSLNKKCDLVSSHRWDESSLSYLAWTRKCYIDMNADYFQGRVMRADKNTGKRNIVTISEHSFDASLLHKTSKVLDCGCRGFEFSKWIAEKIGCRVVSVDADPEIINPIITNVEYIHAAVASGDETKVAYYAFGNGTGNYIANVCDQPAECDIHEVPAYRIKPLWDLIKMDIEGSEYDIFMDMEAPIATQVSVEFHEHTPAAKGDKFMQNLFDRMSVWYEIIGATKEKRHGLSENYWDVLFILKDELWTQKEG